MLIDDKSLFDKILEAMDDGYYDPIINSVPMAVYIKDRKGKYLNQNVNALYMMKNAGFIDKNDKACVINKTDSQLFGRENACVFQEHDQKILDEKIEKPMTFLEKVMLPDDKEVLVISQKKIVLGRKGGVQGIIGCSLQVDNEVSTQLKNHFKNVSESLSVAAKIRNYIKNLKFETLTQCCNEIRQLSIYNHTMEAMQLITTLTNRELQCLCINAKGYTNKHIARFLNVSPRTIEIYIKSLEKKLVCTNKSELTSWFWDFVTRLP